jgi:cell division protein FtsI (penicillin-binding protein 3)
MTDPASRPSLQLVRGGEPVPPARKREVRTNRRTERSDRSLRATRSHAGAAGSTAERESPRRPTSSTARAQRRTHAPPAVGSAAPPGINPANLKTRAARRAAVLARTASQRSKVATASTPSVWRAGRPRQRLLAVFVTLAIAFALLVTRVALLQTVSADDYVRFGEEQRTHDTDVPATRGIIFDRKGDALALSVPAPTIFANPSKILDPKSTALSIGQLLGFTAERINALAVDLAQVDSKFKYVARQIDDATADAIMSLELPGIGSYEEQTRVYPAGDVARGALGKTNIDGEGLTGLEKQFEGLLSGTAGRIVRETDQQGRSITNGERLVEPAIPGQDLRLAISRPIQYEAEQALMDKVIEIGARGGTAIVEDVDTGDLLAIASVRRDKETGEVFVSSAMIPAVDTYEPGSVAKVITVAAAMNEGTVGPETYFDVPWRKMYYDTMLHDAEPHGTESMSVARILAKSSNIGTITISQTIGIEKQEAYMRAFGLGAKTDLDFPGESRGILRPSSEWRGTERVTPAYGQGVATTALQLVGAMNTLANGGTYVAPRLVYSIVDEHGVETIQPPAATREVVSPQVAAQMNLMMRDVICRGTASKAKIDGYTVAGKTGTGYKAQKNGTYFDENGNKSYYASFVGFFPAEQPEVTILVSIDEPPAGGDHFGGSVAAPVFTEIAQAAIHELDIRPPTADGGCAAR